MSSENRVIGPVTKSAVGVGSVASSITVIVVWVAGLNGLAVPDLVAGALTVLIGVAGGFLGGWLVKPSQGRYAASE